MNNKTKGRPKKDPVNSIATMLWFSAMRRATGIQSAAGLYRHLELGEPRTRARNRKACEDQERSKKWELYSRGLHTPATSLVSYVEKCYKGTSQYLSLDLWKISTRHQPDLEVLLLTLATIRPSLVKHFNTCINEQPGHTSIAIPRTIDALWRQGDIPALTALITLARIAEHTADQNLYIDAAIAALNVLVFVMRKKPFFSIKEELFDYYEKLLFAESVYTALPTKDAQCDIHKAVESFNKTIAEAIRINLINDTQRDAAKLMFFSWREGFTNNFQSSLLLGSDQENSQQLDIIIPLMSSDLRRKQRPHTFYQIHKIRRLISKKGF